MHTQVSTLNYRPTNKDPRLTDKEAIIDKLKAERTKIRTQLKVGSYVDNWPYIKVLPEKLRGKLLRKLRLVDEALLRANEALLKANKIRKNNRTKEKESPK
jgi:hypothetical protein